MKKVFLAVIALLCLFACNNDKAEEKKAMDNILATHEKVMASEDRSMTDKMRLDTLIKINQLLPAGLTKPQTNFKQLSDSLTVANEAMENWMHQFDPEYKGKSHADVMKYLSTEQLQINKVDARLNRAISSADKVLAGFKK